MNKCPEAGIFSLKLVRYQDDSSVQFNNQMRFCKQLARIFATKPDVDCVKEPDFYSGAAFFVTKKFVDTVGLMDEQYFLFYEELDWVMAARRCGFRIKYMDNAVVKHKCSVTTGKQPAFSQFCHTRSSLLFTGKYHPYWLVTVICFSLLRSLRQLFRHDLKGAKAIAYAVWCYIFYPRDEQLRKYMMGKIVEHEHGK